MKLMDAVNHLLHGTTSRRRGVIVLVVGALLVAGLVAGCAQPADEGGADTADVSANEEANAEVATNGDDADLGEAPVVESEGDDSGDEPKVELDAEPPPIIDDVPFAPEGEVVELPESGHALIGEPAPDFTMTLLETGEEVSLSDYAGQPVLVNFWATWCPPCRLEMPWFQEAYDTYGDEGFVVLAVDSGERVPPDMVEDMVRRYIDGSELTFPVLLGENAYDVQRDWSVVGLPASFLIGADGTVVDAHQGAYPNLATLEKELEQILAAEG